MMTPFVVLFFLVLSLLPQSVKALTQNCLNQIQTHWSSFSGRELVGRSRHQTDCALKLEVLKNEMNLQADGYPLSIQTSLNQNSAITICKVSKEKLHLEFVKQGDLNSKVEIQILKTAGHGISVFLNQRPVKVLGSMKSDNLICHLN